MNKLVICGDVMSARADAFNKAMGEKDIGAALLELTSLRSSLAQAHREVSARIDRLERYRSISRNFPEMR